MTYGDIQRLPSALTRGICEPPTWLWWCRRSWPYYAVQGNSRSLVL